MIVDIVLWPFVLHSGRHLHRVRPVPLSEETQVWILQVRSTRTTQAFPYAEMYFV